MNMNDLVTGDTVGHIMEESDGRILHHGRPSTLSALYREKRSSSFINIQIALINRGGLLNEGHLDTGSLKLSPPSHWSNNRRLSS